MKHISLIFAGALMLGSALAAPAIAQDEPPADFPSPNAIVDSADSSEWVAIAAEDLLVMTLAPHNDGKEREVIIQLMPAPFSQGWVSNMRTLARAQWYDGITVNRVQDNYVVQWGDPHGEDPEKAKPLPEGLKVMDEGDYLADTIGVQIAKSGEVRTTEVEAAYRRQNWDQNSDPDFHNALPDVASTQTSRTFAGWHQRDAYGEWVEFFSGWAVGTEGNGADQPWWPVHCYGMVGVGRGYSPDTGSGAELYTVIGHAPRHLDRNIALVGRIISGMEYLSSMTRGTGPLGFYTEEEAGLRTPITSIRVASDLPETEQPSFEYLSTEGVTFAKYADARANRRDPFFIVPAGGADICNIPVPVRRVENADEE